MVVKTLHLPNQSATEKLARVLAQAIESRALIALSGQLGTGKTTLVKALAEGLGIDEVVNSPTFVLMNEYHGGRLPLFHFDLYRFGEVASGPEFQAGEKAGKASTTYDLSFITSELDELCAGKGVIVIEWADYIQTGGNETLLDYLGDQDHLNINLRYEEKDERARALRVEGLGPQSTKLVEALFISLKDVLSY